MVELEQREVMRGLLEANYQGVPFKFPSGHLFAPLIMGAALDRVTMEEVKMPSADLRFCSMTDARLFRVDLSAARAQEMGCSRSVFREVCFSRGVFSRSVMRQSEFLACRMERAYFDYSLADGSVWENCQGDRAVFDLADLRESDFRSFRGEGTSFSEADLTRAKFYACHFAGVDFSLSCLMDATFKDCCLRNCSFSGIQASGLSFIGCDLTDTYLSPTVLQNCRIV